MKHPLRDLANKIRALAQEHETCSQSVIPVQACCDHLDAMAGVYEAVATLENERLRMVVWIQ